MIFKALQVYFKKEEKGARVKNNGYVIFLHVSELGLNPGIPYNSLRLYGVTSLAQSQEQALTAVEIGTKKEKKAQINSNLHLKNLQNKYQTSQKGCRKGVNSQNQSRNKQYIGAGAAVQLQGVCLAHTKLGWTEV